MRDVFISLETIKIEMVFKAKRGDETIQTVSINRVDSLLAQL